MCLNYGNAKPRWAKNAFHGTENTNSKSQMSESLKAPDARTHTHTHTLREPPICNQQHGTEGKVTHMYLLAKYALSGVCICVYGLWWRPMGVDRNEHYAASARLSTPTLQRSTRDIYI